MTTDYVRHLSLAKQPSLVRPVHFRSVNVASIPSANVRWASAEAVNFMDHLYFITNLALDYLLENDLPQELLNSTLLDNPVSVLVDHRNELITHFHKLLIAACTCLCIGISIPLFGFMIACCWCSSGKKSPTPKRSSGHPSRSGYRPSSRSRIRESSEPNWLALSTRNTSSHHDRGVQHRTGGSRHHRELERRRRNGRTQRSRSGHGSGSDGINDPINPSINMYRSRSQPPSLKYESTCHPCMRTFFSSNLFMVLLLISFFAVCTFVTNEYVNNGVKQLPKALNQSMDELQVYLNNTDYEVDNLLRVNYMQLENEINQRLDTGGMIIKHKLAVSSEAIALVNLTDIVLEFNDTKYRLERLDREISTLKLRINLAKKSLADLKTKIEACPPDQCPMLRKKYQNSDNFRILPQYERLPDVKNMIKKVTQLIDSGIVNQVQKGREDFDRFGSFIQREVNGTAPEVKLQLSIVGKRLSNMANDISQSIRWSDYFFNHTRSNTKKLNQYAEYEQYRRYACLAGASIILFVLLCYTLGWLYGSCRPQPTPRTYKTRAKTSASASVPFSCGIVVTFLVFLPMILAAIVLFFSGSVGDKVVCRVIKHPEQKQSKQIYAMLQNKFLGSNLSIDSPEEDKVIVEQIDRRDYKIYRPNYADLIARCHQNQSIYKVLKLDLYDKVYLFDDGQSKKISIGLDKSFNLTTREFQRINHLDVKLKELIKHIDLDTSRITLLSPNAEEILRNSMSLSFDDLEQSFSRLYDSGISIFPVDIEQISKDILAQRATITTADADTDLALASLSAANFNDLILPNITSSLLNLKEGIRHLKLRTFHGRNSFGSVINELIAKVRSAEKQLRSDGRTLLKLSANEFSDELNALLNQYANHFRNQVENVIGQCEPVSRALNSTTSTLCDDIILPFNGYWLSAVASLILILPATFLAHVLRGLYKLAKRGPLPHRHNYSYPEPDDETSFEEDGEDIALAYHLGPRSSHLPSHSKPSGSSALPSAPPVATDDGWSPTSSNYAHNSRPPPYAV